MNIDNIKRIMKSNLWKKITRNKSYRGYKIIDTHNKVPRTSGQFFVLLVFFQRANNDLLYKYLKEGRTIGRYGECLDNPEIYNFYGTMKMMRFS